MDFRKTDRRHPWPTSLHLSKMTPPTITVKIAFILDCTGSMEPWIHESKTKIQQIISQNRREHPHAHFEVALVAYRDYGDTIRMRVVDFSCPTQIVRSLEPIHADGGDDQAEDVAGALDRTGGLTWGPSDLRLVFHIADAPAHGMLFHTPRVSDRFPEGDPDGHDPRSLLRHLASQEIQYTFVRITSSTDVMIDVFHDVYTHAGGVFRVIDLHPQSYDGRYGRATPGNMADILSPAVTRIVSDAVSQYTASQGM
jgi:hypothetical protein